MQRLIRSIRLPVKITAWVVLVSMVLYAGWRTTVWVGQHESAVVYDVKSEYISGFYLHGLHWSGFRSLWSHSSVVRGSDAGFFTFECTSPLPGSIASDDKTFTVSATAEVEYRLTKDFICGYEDLGGDYVRRSIIRNAGLFFKNELNARLEAVGNEGGYTQNVKGAVAESFTQLKKRMQENGIELTRCDIISVTYPDEKMFRALSDHRYALIKQLLDKDLEIAGRKMQDEYYDRHLEKISLIINKNPLLLKYIYIDKLGANVKMILPSELDSFTDVPEADRVKGGVSAGRQIDNLK